MTAVARQSIIYMAASLFLATNSISKFTEFCILAERLKLPNEGYRVHKLCHGNACGGLRWGPLLSNPEYNLVISMNVCTLDEI